MLIIDPPAVEVDTDYDGEVVSIATYGAFINILPGRDGLLHISKFHSEKRVSNPENVLSAGDKIKVHVDSIENGKISLSLLEDLEIPEESVDKGGAKKDFKKSDNRKRNDRPNNRNRNDQPRGDKPSDDSPKRKRVSFEDDFEKGI
jgi:polyribonucleotide nucleotidyltransferase